MLAGGTGSRLHPTALVARGNASLKGAMTLNQHAGPLTCIEMGLSMVRVPPYLFSNQEHAEKWYVIRGRLATAAAVNHENKRTSAGRGVEMALRTVLKQAGLDTDKLGHINAHGLSTGPMDAAERRPLQLLL